MSTFQIVQKQVPGLRGELTTGEFFQTQNYQEISSRFYV